MPCVLRHLEYRSSDECVCVFLCVSLLLAKLLLQKHQGGDRQVDVGVIPIRTGGYWCQSLFLASVSLSYVCLYFKAWHPCAMGTTNPE